MKKFIMAISLMLAIVCCFSVTACNLKGNSDKSQSEESEVTVVPQVLLTSNEVNLLSADVNGNKYVSKEITARLYPANVLDTYVTWSVSWDSNAELKNENISHYIKITDESQGNLIAKVCCYKSFRGSEAILTCTTRQGGLTATATIIFEGLPSSLSITPTGGLSEYNLGVDTVDLLLVGNTYSFDLSLDNIFHDVGDGYLSGLVSSVSGVGSVTCKDYYSPQGRYNIWKSGTDKTVNLSSIASEFISASIVENKLQINVLKSFYDYYESYTESGSDDQGYGFKDYYTGKLYSLNTDSAGNLPYFVVTVKSYSSYASNLYKFFIAESVTDVELSDGEITF